MATKKANTSSKPKLSVSAKIDRMIEREDATVKAYASVNIGGAFVIKDIAVVDGQKGMFARMPFRSYKTGSGETKYSDIPQGRGHRKRYRTSRESAASLRRARQQICGVHPRQGIS